jgi:hypothetical protein
MAVSPLGMLDGLTASGIILSSALFGLLSIYHAKKRNADLLGIAGIVEILIGLLWLGPFVDFLFVWLTGNNIEPYPPTIGIYSLLSYSWVAPAITFAMYLGARLLAPDKKKIIVIIYLALGVIFEYFLWFQTLQSFSYNAYGGGDLTDASFVRTHPTFLMIALFLISTLVLLGIGFLIKAKQSIGMLRKKFIYLSLSIIIFVLCGALDSILTIPFAIGFVRIVMTTSPLLMYLGLRP